jgi:hypothetical protein
LANQINVMRRTGEGANITINGTPDECPRCRRFINVFAVWGGISASNATVQTVFRCTSSECDELFIGTYIRNPQDSIYYLDGTAPLKSLPLKFPETVAGVSPTFIEIMNQVVVAEAQQLSQLEGIGLRKGLEFLVKDFSIQQHPTEAEEIKKTLLGNCIEKYVQDENIKQCAKRAAWLGNDETHYTRKWEDKDIEDLKLLVRLTVNWIDNVLMTQKYVQEMQPANP